MESQNTQDTLLFSQFRSTALFALQLKLPIVSVSIFTYPVLEIWRNINQPEDHWGWPLCPRLVHLLHSMFCSKFQTSRRNTSISTMFCQEDILPTSDELIPVLKSLILIPQRRRWRSYLASLCQVNCALKIYFTALARGGGSKIAINSCRYGDFSLFNYNSYYTIIIGFVTTVLPHFN